MEGIKIKTNNVEYNYRDGVMKIKKLQTANTNIGTIEFIVKSKVAFGFSFNKKLVNKITVWVGQNSKPVSNIPHQGIRTSCVLDAETSLKLEIEFIDFCSRVNIFNIDVKNISSLGSITWDNIFIINLPRRVDRKETIIKQMERVGITQYDFISGIDGKSPDIIEQFARLESNIPTAGHYGCLLSHIKAIERAKRENLLSVMILEDDVILGNDFIKVISGLKVPTWDVIYLGGLIPEVKLFFDSWSFCSSVMGAYGYLIQAPMYEVILKELYAQKECVDICMMKNVLPRYKIVLLDDLVKTSIVDTDTSGKTKMMCRMVERISG
jgi:hypothetical protein